MIKRELSTFILVGVFTVLLDLSIYHTLLNYHITSTDPAKTLAFVGGTLFAYFANRCWTFSHVPQPRGRFFRFILLYGCTLGVNVLTNSLSLALLADSLAALQLAFILATSASASLNFVGMKWFVFKPISRTTPQ